MGSSQAIELPRWPVASRARSPSAAAGYPGGRHSCKAEWSWVPIRTFDRSPPMGTVLTVDRLSLLRRWKPGSCTLSAMEAWFLNAVGDGSLVLARCRRWKPGSCTLSAMEAWFLHAADDGSLVLARCRRWKLDHQVLLLDTMVAVTRGILPGHRAPTVAVGIASSITKCCWIPWWPSLVGSTQALERPRWPVASSSITKCCCCWIPRWPVSYYRFPNSSFLIPERIANA